MIRTLNLDGMFTPVPKPEIKFEMFNFNGGELHIKLSPTIDYSIITNVIITHRIRSGDDIMKILIAVDALRRQGIKNLDLVIPYVSYGRQDRVCVNGESFTLKVFSILINSCNFNNVYIIDAHSDVTPALINNCHDISNVQYVAGATVDINTDHLYLISPDSGANKKSNSLFAQSNSFNAVIKCDKVRDLGTGKLSGFQVFAGNLSGSDCLIVDDICDGGGTFIGLAEELKKHGAGRLYLFVTHGIFSNGIEKLLTIFEKVYCTNSFKDIEETGSFKQFKIQI